MQLSTEDYPESSAIETAFNKAVAHVHRTGGFKAEMLRDKAIFNLTEQIVSYLKTGIDKGLMDASPSGMMVQSLRESAGVFGGFKTLHEMTEAANLLVGENGNIKSFEQFSKEVIKINDTYNKHYLKTEYDFAMNSAEAAARWEEQQDDSDGRYALQYRTAGDEKVRESHRKLNGITLPASDPFWDSYYPPNGWNCRCSVVKVRTAKYPVSDSTQAIQEGQSATEGKHAEMFRFNPGKQRAAYPAYNSYTISKCNICPKAGGVELAKIPNNELCAACPIIQECAHDITKSQSAIEKKHYLREMEPLLHKKIIKTLNDGRTLNIGFTKKGNEHLYSDTFKRALGALRREDLKNLDKIIKDADYLNFSPLTKQRADNIVGFHYFSSKINGIEILLNIAIEERIDKGRKRNRAFLYSVTKAKK